MLKQGKATAKSASKEHNQPRHYFLPVLFQKRSSAGPTPQLSSIIPVLMPSGVKKQENVSIDFNDRSLLLNEQDDDAKLLKEQALVEGRFELAEREGFEPSVQV
jgi:hypothetical protein